MKFWYLIYSKPKDEKVAQENLERQGYETYLPLILGRTKRRGKNNKIHSANVPEVSIYPLK